MIPEFEDLLFGMVEAQIVPDVKRVTRSQKASNVVAKVNNVALPRSDTPTPEDRRLARNNKPSEAVPFLQQDLPSEEDEEDDEDYVYDEELNKTFNRTVEDITIDDISRHLETLELVQSEDEAEDPRAKQQQQQQQRQQRQQQQNQHHQQPSRQSSNGYKIPSSTTSRHLRSNRTSKILNFEDSDISMISHISPAKKHTTRSGRTKW